MLDEHIEAVQLAQTGDYWDITVYLRYPDGSKSEYLIYSGRSKSEAKTRLDSFMALYCNVEYIE